MTHNKEMQEEEPSVGLADRCIIFHKEEDANPRPTRNDFVSWQPDKTTQQQ